MKTRITLIFLLCLSINAYTQDCSDVLFMKEGAVLTYTGYNKKGKERSSTIHKTISVTQENDNYTAIINATKKDNKDKETFSTNFNTRCNGGLFSVDMMRFMDYDKISEQQKDGIALEIDGDVLEFPVNSNVGDEMDDGHVNIRLNSKGFTIVKMTFDIKNRKIVGEENITTPAGTFACQKVTFDFESKIGFLKVKGSGIEWYHNNVVVIKSESYNKKGKLTGFHQLTGVR